MVFFQEINEKENILKVCFERNFLTEVQKFLKSFGIFLHDLLVLLNNKFLLKQVQCTQKHHNTRINCLLINAKQNNLLLRRF